MQVLASGTWPVGAPVPLDSGAPAAHVVSGILRATLLICDFLPRISPTQAPFCYFPIFSGVPFVSEKHKTGQKHPV